MKRQIAEDGAAVRPTRLTMPHPQNLVYRIKDLDNGDWLVAINGRVAFINREEQGTPFPNFTAAEMIALNLKAKRNENDDPFNFEIVPSLL